MQRAPDLLVSDLMRENHREWDGSKLETIFAAEVVDQIKDIPLSIRDIPDELYWRHTTDGSYTVKSGYWLGFNGNIADGDNRCSFWKAIWAMKAPPKLVHFIWRASSNALAVKANLF